MFKSTAMLALAFALFSAKTYKITIYSPMQAGSTQLTPGEYRLEVDGSGAVLKDRSGHIEVAGTVQNVDRKVPCTSVTTYDQDGVRRLESIRIGGTISEVHFE